MSAELNDADFLTYFEARCEKRHPFFSRAQCQRLYALAEEPWVENEELSRNFFNMPPEYAKPLIEKARKRIEFLIALAKEASKLDVEVPYPPLRVREQIRVFPPGPEAEPQKHNNALDSYPVLHLYQQEHQHGDAWIVGTLEGLKLLRDTIDRAIANDRTATAAFTPTDGEGFKLIVEPVTLEEAEILQWPYTDPFGSYKGPGMHPFEMFGSPDEGSIVDPTSV